MCRAVSCSHENRPGQEFLCERCEPLASVAKYSCIEWSLANSGSWATKVKHYSNFSMLSNCFYASFISGCLVGSNQQDCFIFNTGIRQPRTYFYGVPY